MRAAEFRTNTMGMLLPSSKRQGGRAAPTMAPVVKVRVTNPMHDSRQSMNDMSSPLQLNTPSQTDDLESDDDGTASAGPWVTCHHPFKCSITDYC